MEIGEGRAVVSKPRPSHQPLRLRALLKGDDWALMVMIEDENGVEENIGHTGHLVEEFDVIPPFFNNFLGG